MDRFKIEIAVEKSDLHPIMRHLVLVFCRRMYPAESGLIPKGKGPSITDIVLASGWSRTTICRRLADLEQAGWLIRTRAPRARAAAEHIKTEYQVTVPPKLAALVTPSTAAPAPRPPQAAAAPLIQSVIDGLRDRTGKTVTEREAEQIAQRIVDGAKEPVRDPELYVPRAIQRDPNPGRWLPAPSPPQYRNGRFVDNESPEGHRRQ
jgi:hypothetical protein